MASTCPVCHASPCYLICPTQDPYAGQPQAEHEDHEAGARYDDVRERFGSHGDIDDRDDEPAVADPNSLQSLSWQSRREIQRVADEERAKAIAALRTEDDILF